MSSAAPPPPPNSTPNSPNGVPDEAVSPTWGSSSSAASPTPGPSSPPPASDQETKSRSIFDADVMDAPTRRHESVPSSEAPTTVTDSRPTIASRGVGSSAASPTVSAPADRPQLRGTAPAGPRRVKLSMVRVDVWSVTKLGFLLSVAIGIMMVVAAVLTWSVLDSMEVFGRINDLLMELRVPALLDLMQFVEFDSMLSIVTLIAVLNIVLLTALSAIMALLYNIVAALVGGVHLTLMDE